MLIFGCRYDIDSCIIDVKYRDVITLISISIVFSLSVSRLTKLIRNDILHLFAERCNCIAIAPLSPRYVCLSSATQVYCDKTAEVRIMQFSLDRSPMP